MITVSFVGFSHLFRPCLSVYFRRQVSFLLRQRRIMEMLPTLKCTVKKFNFQALPLSNCIHLVPIVVLPFPSKTSGILLLELNFPYGPQYAYLMWVTLSDMHFKLRLVASLVLAMTTVHPSKIRLDFNISGPTSAPTLVVIIGVSQWILRHSGLFLRLKRLSMRVYGFFRCDLFGQYIIPVPTFNCILHRKFHSGAKSMRTLEIVPVNDTY